MKFYRLILILSLSAFFSCAVQAPPGGGPIYDKALTISDITPPPIVSTGMNKKETVKIFFNQMVDPYTAKMSFSVYPETKINVNVIIIPTKNIIASKFFKFSILIVSIINFIL